MVVEKVSGLTLAEFFQKRITGPLGMRGHAVLPAAGAEGPAGGRLRGEGRRQIERAPNGMPGQGHYVEGPRVAFSGGAGLLSTARDYGRFLQMLLNGGELDGVRLLSPKTVELMTVEPRGHALRRARARPTPAWASASASTWSRTSARTAATAREGAFGWGGAYHTTYWVDPHEKLVARAHDAAPARRAAPTCTRRFRTLVYQSIVGPPTGVAAAPAKR